MNESLELEQLLIFYETVEGGKTKDSNSKNSKHVSVCNIRRERESEFGDNTCDDRQ